MSLTMKKVQCQFKAVPMDKNPSPDLTLSKALAFRGDDYTPLWGDGRRLHTEGVAVWTKDGREIVQFEFLVTDTETSPDGLRDVLIELNAKSGSYKSIVINGKSFDWVIDGEDGDYLEISREALQKAFACGGTDVSLVDFSGNTESLSFEDALAA